MATMPKAPSPSTNGASPSFAFPFTFTPLSLLRMTGFGGAVATWLELLRFTAHRLEAQADYWQRLSQCSDLSDAMQQQRAFIGAAVSEYASEAATIGTKTQEGLTAAAA